MIPKISVVVPLYNRKNYVQQTVDSALNQNLDDYEILILDNQSTDGSYELCQKLYINNPKIKIIRQKFQCGLGGARNIGISLARGKYIAFLDSDDLYVKDGLKHMYEIAEATNADVVHAVGWLESLDDGGSTIRADSQLKPHVADTFNLTEIANLSPEIQIRLQSLLNRTLNNLNAWSKIYRRDYLIENALTFPDTLNEDVNFLILNLLNAERYVIAPIFWNVYRIAPDSLSFGQKDASFLAKVIDTLALAMKHLNDNFKASAFLRNNPAYSDALREFFLMHLFNFNLFRWNFYGIIPLDEIQKVVRQTFSKYISDETQLEICCALFNYTGIYNSRLNQALVENKILAQKIQGS